MSKDTDHGVDPASDKRLRINHPKPASKGAMKAPRRDRRLKENREDQP
jgi:hypothetical protein